MVEGMANTVALRGVGAYLPERRVTGAEVEARIREASPRCRVPNGIIELVSGVRERRFADDGVHASDLAAGAARAALDRTETDPAAIDLLIFAAASQDLAEPATANIVQEKVGTAAAVFDLKNACNSFLNAVQVAEGLILTGPYRTVLVATGETPSRAIRWDAPTREDLRLNLPGYTLGDGGAAAILARSDDGRGIFYRHFHTVSRFWPAATLPGGGSMHPRGDEHTYIRGDGAALKAAFAELGPDILHRALRETGTTFDDYAAILVHQVSLPYLRDFARATAIPSHKIVVTLPCLGNLAAASLPVAFARAWDEGRVRPGDRVMWIGLAAGISVGIVLMTV